MLEINSSSFRDENLEAQQLIVKREHGHQFSTSRQRRLDVNNLAHCQTSIDSVYKNGKKKHRDDAKKLLVDTEKFASCYCARDYRELGES